MKRLIIGILFLVVGFSAASFANEADKKITLIVQVDWAGQPEISFPLLFSGVLRTHLTIDPSCFTEVENEKGVFRCDITHKYSSATPSSYSTDLSIQFSYGSTPPSCNVQGIVKGEYTIKVLVLGGNPPSTAPPYIECELEQ